MDGRLCHARDRVLCLLRYTDTNCQPFTPLMSMQRYNLLKRRSSSSSCTSSSSRAAIRFFRVSYICEGSTGCSAAFFLPFGGGACVPFTAAPFVVRAADCGWDVFGGTGGAAAGAGGVGPAGAGLPCLAGCAPFMAGRSAVRAETGILTGRQQEKRRRSRLDVDAVRRPEQVQVKVEETVPETAPVSRTWWQRLFVCHILSPCFLSRKFFSSCYHHLIHSSLPTSCASFMANPRSQLTASDSRPIPGTSSHRPLFPATVQGALAAPGSEPGT